MSVHERGSVLRRNPYRDRRSFVARAMALTPIGDIGSAALPENTGTTETLTWETSTDWDNAASESGVVHESVTNTDHDDDTLVKMGYSSASPFKSADTEAYYPLHEDSGTTAYDFSGNNYDGSITGATVNSGGLLGTTGYDFTESNGDYVDLQNQIFTDDTTVPFTVIAIVNPDTTDTSEHHIVAWEDNGSSNYEGITCRLKGNDWELALRDSNGRDVSRRFARSNGSSTSTLYHVVFTYDGSQSKSGINIYEDGALPSGTANFNEGLASTYGFSGNSSIACRDPSEPGGFYGGLIYNPQILVGVELTQSQAQTHYDVYNSESSLTTATKSFSSLATPDLQNLSYTLNSHTIILDVIGSPGTASEEIVSQTLDGASSYSLTWSNSHTDFRVKPKFDTSDATVTPTVSRIALTA